MKGFEFRGLLGNQGWICPAYVRVDDSGIINLIEKRTDAKAEKINGYALPGFQNAHSHAFQYAMAGLAEVHPPAGKADNFWSWREKMYRTALGIDPDQMEAIAAMLYAEMLRHGYTQVAEFHYLHHDKNGKPYHNQAEMGERLVSAAQKTGIKITLVPVFYQRGGFGKEPEDRQKRFISPSLDSYWQLLEASKNAVSSYDGASLGFGVHSLRAVQGTELVRTLKEGPAGLPFHIHLSEQLKEVQDCLAFCGMRPAEYLFDQVEADDRFHLVHATHLSDNEVKSIASAGAHVALCPSTEGNLGDGLFRLRDYKELNGKWSIGTDSHISLNPLEELRLLDYGQRLFTHQRDTFVGQSGDSGAYAFQQALVGGRKAMGNPEETYFGPGQLFDAVVYDGSQPLISTTSPDNLLSTIIYCGEATFVLGTIVNGKWAYRKNDNRKGIADDFIKTIQQLRIR